MITLAIPFYSNRPMLEACLRSVLRQTRTDWKLLLIDDSGKLEGAIGRASETDPRSEGLADWIRSRFPDLDNRIKYIAHRENLGMAATWNDCLELAETDWVTILHSDDELLPNYVDAMARGIGRFPEAAALFCQTRIIDEDGNETFSFADWYKGLIRPGKLLLASESGLSRLLKGNFIMCPTLCYNKRIIGQERFDTKWRMVLDLDFTTRLLLSEKWLAGLSDVAYAYRRHLASATSRYNENLLRFDEEIAFYDHIAETAGARGWKAAQVTARKKRIIRLHLLYQIARDLSRFQAKAAGRKWLTFRRL
ncbi:MAG: hypothetical protein A2428_15595 [Bdellovibrionales bacterium RIFOXYC1_FULL_54_43]|nr:MAG: hypothetical protein A2428_15595 [Bdellovibrionales bacterium RIFOXYC1_FULL_54_43]